MQPDRFSGDGVDALRQKVEEIVKEKSATGNALRITLPAEDWKQENVLEGHAIAKILSRETQKARLIKLLSR